MADGEEPPQQSGSANTFTLDLQNMPITVNTQGRLPSNFRNVIRDLERRISNNPYIQTSSHTTQHPLPVVTGTTPLHANQMQTDPENGSFVVNIGMNTNGQGGEEGTNETADENQNAAAGGTPAANAHQHNMSNLRQIWRLVEGVLPFVLLLMAKVLFNHRLGILVFVGLFGTFWHANTTLTRQIAQRERKHFADALGYLAWTFLFICGNIFFIYYVFEEEKLYRSLIFQLPDVDKIDAWTLVWIVGITDFVVKFAAIAVKAVMAVLPRKVVPFKRRGKYYMIIEEISQYYRCLLPIIPWLHFLYDDEHGGQWFSFFLLGAYTLCKGHAIWKKTLSIMEALRKFRLDVSYGTSPTREETKTAGDACPICQDEYKDAIKLNQCGHIFCEDCVSMWFDRERTCPMCREKIVDNPIWRDGSTTAAVQVF